MDRKQADSLLTSTELKFYEYLKAAVKDDFGISLKTRLFDLFDFNERKAGWISNQLHLNKIGKKHIDFVLFDLITAKIICCIELDDWTHIKKVNRKNDEVKNEYLRSVNIPLLRIPVANTYDVIKLRNQINVYKENKSNITIGDYAVKNVDFKIYQKHIIRNTTSENRNNNIGYNLIKLGFAILVFVLIIYQGNNIARFFLPTPSNISKQIVSENKINKQTNNVKQTDKVASENTKIQPAINKEVSKSNYIMIYKRDENRLPPTTPREMANINTTKYTEQMHSWVDSQGKVHFSNTSQPDPRR